MMRYFFILGTAFLYLLCSHSHASTVIDKPLSYHTNMGLCPSLIIQNIRPSIDTAIENFLSQALCDLSSIYQNVVLTYNFKLAEEKELELLKKAKQELPEQFSSFLDKIFSVARELRQKGVLEKDYRKTIEQEVLNFNHTYLIRTGFFINVGWVFSPKSPQLNAIVFLPYRVLHREVGLKNKKNILFLEEFNNPKFKYKSTNLSINPQGYNYDESTFSLCVGKKQHILNILRDDLDILSRLYDESITLHESKKTTVPLLDKKLADKESILLKKIHSLKLPQIEIFLEQLFTLIREGRPNGLTEDNRTKLLNLLYNFNLRYLVGEEFFLLFHFSHDIKKNIYLLKFFPFKITQYTSDPKQSDPMHDICCAILDGYQTGYETCEHNLAIPERRIIFSNCSTQEQEQSRIKKLLIDIGNHKTPDAYYERERLKILEPLAIDILQREFTKLQGANLSILLVEINKLHELFHQQDDLVGLLKEWSKKKEDIPLYKIYREFGAIITSMILGPFTEYQILGLVEDYVIWLTTNTTDPQTHASALLLEEISKKILRSSLPYKLTLRGQDQNIDTEKLLTHVNKILQAIRLLDQISFRYQLIDIYSGVISKKSIKIFGQFFIGDWIADFLSARLQPSHYANSVYSFEFITKILSEKSNTIELIDIPTSNNPAEYSV